VVLVRVRHPLYSVRHVETYQVALSYPLLPPSTVLGAVGFALAQAGLCSGDGVTCNEKPCVKAARELVDKARDVAVGTVAKFPVVLRRLRGVLEERRLPKDVGEFTGFSDAMVREYVFATERTILLVPRRGAAERLAKALWLLERLGDSESLASVVGVEVAKAERCEGLVNVVVRAEAARGGAYTVVKMFDEDCAEGWFAAPVRLLKGGLYVPGGVEVEGPVLCAGSAVFPGGGSW